MYISKEDFTTYLASISRLLNLFQENKNIEIYPSHEEFDVGKDLLIDLSKGIQNIENIWNTKVRDDFIDAWLLSDETFKYLVFWSLYNLRFIDFINLLVKSKEINND